VKAAIVVTSIHDCTELLDGYFRNFAKYGHEAKIYLIPDIKTPEQKFSSSVEVPLFVTQARFLDKVGFPTVDIPWNSDNRRNVGYLMALADGAEMIVSIDDDNYAPEFEDFIGGHLDGIGKYLPCVRTDTGWLNNCELFDSANNLFPRGFPYYARNKPKIILTAQQYPVRINAGMWIIDPDLDAMTWLHHGMVVTGSQGQFALASDMWCPINSQNTAVHRDLMAAYYFIRMVPPSDRFGDIFQGYFALKVAKHMGWTARFGSPVVTHRRNSHVYLKDVQKEIEPILMLEELLPKLIEHKLTGTTVHEAYLSLADFIQSQNTQFYSDTARLMRQWAETCRRING
jgi:Reversibly glycosylated polypeptide